MDTCILNRMRFLHIRRERWRGGHQWGTLFVINQFGEWDPVCYLYEVPGSEDDLGLFYQGNTRLHEGTYEVRIHAGGPRSWGIELYEPTSQKHLPIKQVRYAFPNQACLMLIDFSDLELGSPRKRDWQLRARSRALMERIRIQWSVLGFEPQYDSLATVTTTWPTNTSPRPLHTKNRTFHR